MKIKQVLIIIILLPIAISSLIVLKNMIKEDYKLYKAEGKCINIYIQKGYEREKIQTGQGICWIKKED